MKYWDEVRTVAKVARLGTVSEASRELGVHRATVQRHVEQMEEALGVRLFLKHTRGYTPTEAALELRRVAEEAEEEISRIARRIELTEGDYEASVSITSAPALGPLIVQTLKEVCQTYPGLRLNYISSTANLKLESGEADIAIRGGAKPDNPEYVVQELETLQWGLYASPTYVARKGLPADEGEFDAHFFAGPLNAAPKLSMLSWINQNVPPRSIVIRSDNVQFLEDCVLDGAAIGLISSRTAAEHRGMVEVTPPLRDWISRLWLVTHVDQHRLPKVQACLAAIKTVFNKDDLKAE